MIKYPDIGLDYAADLEIDKFSLDDEWLGQSLLMMSYAEKHAQAIFDRDRAKQALDITRANLDSEIRIQLNGTKYTEAVVDGKIKVSPDYIEALDTLNKAEYKINILRGAVIAFNARKDALEFLVRLHLASYFSRPQAPEGAGAIEETASARRLTEHEAALSKEELPNKKTPTPVSVAPERKAPPTPVRRSAG